MALEYTALRTTGAQSRRVVTYSSNNQGTQWQGVPVTNNRPPLQKLRSLLLCMQHARRKLHTRMLELRRRFQYRWNSHGFPFQWACKSNCARPHWGSRRWSHHTSPHKKDHIRAGGAGGTDGATDSSKHTFWEHPPPHGAWIALVHHKVVLPQDNSTVWFVRHMSGDREAGDVTVVLEQTVAGKENDTERRLWEPRMVWVPTIIRKHSKQVVRQVDVDGICADAESNFVEAQSAEWLIVGHGCKKAKRHFVYFRCRKRTCDCADVAGSVVWGEVLARSNSS